MIPGGGWWAGLVARDGAAVVGVAVPVVAWVPGSTPGTQDQLRAFVARAGTGTAVPLDSILKESSAGLVGVFPEGALPTWAQIEQVRR
ncbi:MAG: hypothetical protein KIT14_22655 [bacterium]|nr:hypothetical protein [bacterium]